MMSSSPQPRIAKRRYNQFKKTILNDIPRFADLQQTDNLLQKDQAYYRQLFERSGIIKLIVDPTTLQIWDANPAACAFYGYTLAQIKTLRLSDIHTQPESEIRLAVQKAIAVNTATFETRHRLASGNSCDVGIQAELLVINNKQYIYAIIQDITSRKKLEKALRESEAMYRLFAHNMPDSSVVMFDTDMRYTLVEGPFLKRFGTIAETMLGKTPQEALDPQVVDFIVSVYQRALNGETFSYERVNLDYAYQAHVTPVRDEDGRIIGGMILSHDITEAKRAEAALRASEERFRLITDNMQDIVTLGDQNRQVIYTNPSYTRILGYDIEPLIGHSPFEYVHPEDRMEMMRLLQAAQLAHESEARMEFRWRHADGHYLDFDAIGKFLYDDHFNYRGGIIVARDISERKRMEEQLRASEERLRLITDNIQDLISQNDAQEQVIFASASSHLMLGYEPDEITGNLRRELVHPDDWEKMVAARQNAINAHLEKVTIEGRFRHAEGHYINVEIVAKLRYDDQSKYLGGIYVTRDITERKRLEEQLRVSEEELRLITDNVNDLITQNDVKGRLVFVSASSRTMLGYEPDDLLNKSSLDLIHPDDLAPMGQAFRTAYETGASQFTIEGRLRHAAGHYVAVETVGKIILDDQSRPLSGVYIARDITERKRLQELFIEQEKLQIALQKEQELGSLKTSMMQRIAHEFRTPLAIIQVSQETLTHYYERLTPDKRALKADVIKKQIRHITDMLDEIGLVVSTTFMPDHIHLVSTDISALCLQVATELAAYFNLPDKYVLDMPETLYASIDSRVLKNALYHIMRNAARFSEPAAPVIVRLSQVDNTLELQVIDTGIGIQPEELPRIFEPFFRGTNINERSGLGVGLTIAHAAIQSHGGTIHVQSEVGKGTTVVVSLTVLNPLTA